MGLRAAPASTASVGAPDWAQSRVAAAIRQNAANRVAGVRRKKRMNASMCHARDAIEGKLDVRGHLASSERTVTQLPRARAAVCQSEPAVARRRRLAQFNPAMAGRASPGARG